MASRSADGSFVVRGTEILPTDTPDQRLQKLARITLDEMYQLVGLLDTDGTLLECNRAALEGGGLTRGEVIGKPFWETFWWTVTPKTQEDLREAIQRAAAGESIRYDVEVYAKKSGKEIMVMDFTLLPVRDHEGRVVYLLPEGRDITEKKAHEREIARKNIELQGLLERIRELDGPGAPNRQGEGAASPVAGRPLVLVVEDNQDMNRFVSGCLSARYQVISAFDGRDGLEKALRHRPALIVSDIVMSDVSGDDMIARMRMLPELQTTPILLLSAKADEELMVRLLDEGAQDFIVKPFSENDLMVRARNLIVAQQAREETTRSLVREQRAREAAELQKRTLHSLFMQAPTLIAVLRGPRHVVELANPPICRAWKRTPQEVLDRPLLDVMPELRDQVFPALLDQVYRTGVPYVGKEIPATLDRGDGTMETSRFDFVYTPFRGVDGQIEGIFVVASDVTAEVHAREQMKGLREAAESANRAKDEFLAILGHELRNPLSPILTALQLMKMQGPEGSERARTVIERQVTHLTRLVDDLLDVSRIARGKVELKIQVVETSDLVAKAMEMTSPLLEQRNHTVTVDVPRSGLRLDGDPTRLGQVLSNLLTNAAKYTSPGGNIAVGARQDGNEVVLSVRDNGIGIAPDVLPRIFDLFVQERQAIDRSQGGLGIGLTIVRNLIHGHGGSIAARSEGPGRGSEFIVRLPVAARRTDSAAARTSSADGPEARAPRTGARRILVVDDNEDGAALLAEALAWKGYDTRVAHDAPEALRVAAEFVPDIAFLDIGLPVMDGYELAAHLRDLPGLAGLRLVALTGYGQLSDRQRTREAGFDHHLVKPVNLEAALSSIKDLAPER